MSNGNDLPVPPREARLTLEGDVVVVLSAQRIERRGGYDRMSGDGAARPGRIVHATAEARSQSVDDGYAPSILEGVASQPCFGCIGTDDRHVSERGAEWQRRLTILEQYDGLARRVARADARLRIFFACCRTVGAHVRMLEQTELELCSQHPRHGAVDRARGDRAASKGRQIGSCLSVGGLEDHVESRFDRVLRGGGDTRFRVVEDDRSTNRGLIRNYESS